MTASASTYDLLVLAPIDPSATLDEPTPTDSFVSGLVASLAWTFDLDEVEQELAGLLLFGRPLGVIARRLGVCVSSAQRLCQALFTATSTDGRERLFELGLRLSAMRELSQLVAREQAPARVQTPTLRRPVVLAHTERRVAA